MTVSITLQDTLQQTREYEAPKSIRKWSKDQRSSCRHPAFQCFVTENSDKEIPGSTSHWLLGGWTGYVLCACGH